MHDTAIEMAKRMLVDSIWKSANLEYANSITLLREYDKIAGELLFHYAGEIRTIPVQIGGTSWEPEMPHTGIIMDAMEEIDQIEDIELKALKYFCYVARTQMFIDGNKRAGMMERSLGL